MKINEIGRSIGMLCLISSAFFSVSGCSDGTAATLPAAVEQAQLQPGQLLTAEPATEYPALNNANNFLITYVSTSWNGHNTVVSGQIAVPKTPPPAGGYPVMSFGYGVRGQADNCAPSNALVGDRGNYDSFLNEWVKRGYAVLRTDYEALGTPGARSNGHGRSNANTIGDIVSAAHALSDKLSNDWVAVGHSQGGGAAVWTAGLKPVVGGKYTLKGAVAISPTGPGIPLFMDDVVNGKPVSDGAQGFIPIVVLSAKVIDPTIDLSSLVTPQMQPTFDAMRTLCTVPPIAGLQPGQYLKPGPSYDAVAKFARAQDPSFLEIKVPLSIVQGLSDETTVTPESTRAMVKSLCSRSALINYKEYAGQTHRGVIPVAQEDILGFTALALGGNAPRTPCT